jgi:hypothetical protein
MGTDQKTSIRISRIAAQYVRRDAPREVRLKAARCEYDLSSDDLPVVLFCLSRDPDPEIKSIALSGLKDLPEDVLLTACGSVDTHPRLLELLARLHFRKPAITEAISRNPAADERILAFLAEQGVWSVDDKPEDSHMSNNPPDLSEGAETPGSDEEETEKQPEDDEEEFKNKFNLAQEMSIHEKIKMALTGDKEWRMILVKDNNKMISSAVIKNPRLTEPEVLLIVKSALNNDDVIRDVCNNKEWPKNYQIKKALVENHKTPLHFALRFLAGLTEKDIAVIAKSKNVASVISTQAKRLLMNKKQG